MTRRPLAVLATLIILAVAGCSSHASANPSASSSPPSNNQVLDIGRQAAQCFREHGIPDFPDPVIDQQGQLALRSGDEAHVKGELNANPAAQQACQPILDRLPASTSRRSGQYSQEDLANLLKFAQCMRRNGIPEWPDPNADGSFPISGTPLAAEGKSPRVRTAMQACKQYWDNGIVGS